MMRRSVLLARPLAWRVPGVNARSRRPNFALVSPSSRTMTTSSSGGGGGLWAGYLRLLEQKPLTTKVVTSGVIAAVGDVLCQSWFEGHVDGKRLAIFSFLGAALVGPPCTCGTACSIGFCRPPAQLVHSSVWPWIKGFLLRRSCLRSFLRSCASKASP